MLISNFEESNTLKAASFKCDHFMSIYAKVFAYWLAQSYVRVTILGFLKI